MTFLLLLTALTPLLLPVSADCYTQNGTADWSFHPCDMWNYGVATTAASPAPYTCCHDHDICLSNGVCQYSDQWAGTNLNTTQYYRGTCYTGPPYEYPDCPTFCLGFTEEETELSTYPMEKCPDRAGRDGDRWFCYSKFGGDDVHASGTFESCTDPNFGFTLPGGETIFTTIFVPRSSSTTQSETIPAAETATDTPDVVTVDVTETVVPASSTTPESTSTSSTSYWSTETITTDGTVEVIFFTLDPPVVATVTVTEASATATVTADVEMTAESPGRTVTVTETGTVTTATISVTVTATEAPSTSAAAWPLSGTGTVIGSVSAVPFDPQSTPVAPSSLSAPPMPTSAINPWTFSDSWISIDPQPTESWASESEPTESWSPPAPTWTPDPSDSLTSTVGDPVSGSVRAGRMRWH